MNPQTLNIKKFKQDMFWKPYKRQFRILKANVRSIGANYLIAFGGMILIYLNLVGWALILN